MARLVKTRVEWEGNVYERSSVVEGEEPSAWEAGARYNFKAECFKHR